MKQYTLNRKTYKDVKRMDHQQMDAFCKNLYKAGHADGMKDAEGLTEDEVREVILGVKGRAKEGREYCERSDCSTERKELVDKWIRVKYIWKYRSSLVKMYLWQ